MNAIRQDCIDEVAAQLRTDAQFEIFTSLLSQGDRLATELRQDADALLFATRELEYVMGEVYKEEYADLMMANGGILPLDTEVPEGAEYWTYYLQSSAGVAVYAADYSDGTMPTVSLQGAKVQREVQDINIGYSYTTKQMRNAQFAGRRLDPDLADAARRAHEEKHHSAGMWGRPDLGIDGWLTHPNITLQVAAPVGLGNSTDFRTKDADQIIADFASLYDTVEDLTHGKRKPTRICMSRRVRSLLRRRRLGAGDGYSSLLSFLMDSYSAEKNDGVGVEFMVINELDYRKAALWSAPDQPNVSVTAETGDWLVAYIHNQPRLLSLVMVMMFRQQPVQVVDLTFKVPTESSIGGVKMKEPLTMSVMQGVYL
ncbi:MAG: DUF2184 domain-containing protein [Myxococcales bacterium]|nr:DUF2184 domain-containing protein [Myxococcales bacterium]